MDDDARNSSPCVSHHRQNGYSAGAQSRQSALITESIAMATSLQSHGRPQIELLEMAIRWEALRAAWFSTTQQWREVDNCLARQQRLEATLQQARSDDAADRQAHGTDGAGHPG